MLSSFFALIHDEEGASAVEYGLVVGLIAVIIIAFLILIGGDAEGNSGLAKLFNDVAQAINGDGN